MVLRLGTQAVECVRRIWYSLKTWHIPGKRRALHLPNEILMIIISELTSDGNNSDTSHSTLNKKTLAALASCRLASSTLYLVATPRIFSSILLADTTPRKRPDRQKVFVERATKFNEILTTTSIYNIAASVHTLTLSCIYPDTLNNSINCTLMSVILHRLSHIQKFALESPEFLVFFSSIPGDFASAIQAMCRSPNFTALSLNGVLYFPLTACPNLRCLRLQRAVISNLFWHFLQQFTIPEFPVLLGGRDIKLAALISGLLGDWRRLYIYSWITHFWRCIDRKTFLANQKPPTHVLFWWSLDI